MFRGKVKMEFIEIDDEEGEFLGNYINDFI